MQISTSFNLRRTHPLSSSDRQTRSFKTAVALQIIYILLEKGKQQVGTELCQAQLNLVVDCRFIELKFA